MFYFVIFRLGLEICTYTGHENDRFVLSIVSIGLFLQKEIECAAWPPKLPSLGPSPFPSVPQPCGRGGQQPPGWSPLQFVHGFWPAHCREYAFPNTKDTSLVEFSSSLVHVLGHKVQLLCRTRLVCIWVHHPEIHS